ncbi:serine hydrolase domain-containing protein [Halalkalibacter urbisdiaboli]|uniref:serine hydrolase domain-containing protein n=1 Tax=Halalkalibacter urbisdiaboli TaxID=1960589 RepID=UPI0013FDEF2D|nr:serine hydrolase domain-containing protein [Halalkalibacter urbisdiaboli]
MASTKKSVESLQKELDDYCTALSKLGYFNGSVLVALEGTVFINKGFGMANIELEVVNTSKTIFGIGSISKQFTAAAILVLQEKNLIRVTEPISKYLPEYPNGEKITIHHLLTHSSGIPNYTELSNFDETVKFPVTIEERVNYFKDVPLVFEPGERFEYCNSNYALLTYIIEIITNRSFESILNDIFFNPLGMKHTGRYDYRKIIKNRASSYGLLGDIVNAEFMDMSHFSGDGGLYSTTEDLFIWDQALHSGKILHKESYSLMTTIHEANYGYGLILFEERIRNKARKVIAHGGGIKGFVCDFRNYIDDKLTIIVLSNFFTTQSRKVANALARIVLNEEVSLPDQLEMVPLVYRYDHFIGDYKVYEGPYNTYSVSSKDGKLYISNDLNWYRAEIIPYSQEVEDISFFTKGIEGGSVTFKKGEIHVNVFGMLSKATKI